MLNSKICNYLLQRIPESRKETFILLIMRFLNIDPLLLAYKSIGILKWKNTLISGESFVINEVIPFLLKKSKDNPLVLFDVGSNVGNYARELRKRFNEARIFAFEPNVYAFQKNLSLNFKNDIELYNFGFCKHENNQKLFVYKNNLTTGHGTIHEHVISGIHKKNNLESLEVSMRRLDSFCSSNRIERINFLKIDTEGNELNVLHGAKELLDRDRIDIIQFEFNEMNIISRVFFKDFFDLLEKKYSIFRVDTKRLINLENYNSFYEIFKYQNILAVHRKFKNELGELENLLQRGSR